MTRIFRIPAATALVLCLGACAPDYVAPTGDGTAEVVFASDVPKLSVHLSTYEPTNEECRNRRDLGRVNTFPLMNQPETRTTVTAGTPFVFRLFEAQQIYNGVSNCTVTLKFLPRAGQRYAVDVEHCAAKVYRIDATLPGGREPEPSLAYSRTQCD